MEPFTTRHRNAPSNLNRMQQLDERVGEHATHAQKAGIRAKVAMHTSLTHTRVTQGAASPSSSLAP
eukprot:EC814108.1.p5 GENE.EC814108.1~~EC814108.1.p5  ORF type:complete len:66 (+),score=8.02 EC814108.1:341-538(+)